MPWTALTQTESITSRFKLEVLKRIFQIRNFIQKFSSRVYCTFKEPRHNMAGGHVFSAPRNLCVFLFTYLSFTTLLNVDCSWRDFVYFPTAFHAYNTERRSIQTEICWIVSFKTQPRESSSRPYSDAQLYLGNDDDLFVQ